MAQAMDHAGDLLVEMLIDYGVTRVFGMPGGQTTALHDAILRRQDKIRHILMRDERNAAYAADGYARVTGKVGVCDVTVGPGANLLPAGFLEALNASIPMVGIVGDVPLDWLSLKTKGIASQAFDQVAFFKTCCKDAFQVPSLESLPEMVRTAFRIATAPRPGPVALVIPHDIFDADWYREALKATTDDRTVFAPYLRCVPPPADVAQAAALIRKAKRPALICGGGVHGSAAAEVVTQFADGLGGLVVTSLTGKGSVPETRSYVAGVLNPLGAKAAIDLIGEADLTIWCGSKVSQNTGMNWTLPTPDQASITIDMDPLEHGRTFRPTVPLLGDIRETVRALGEALGDRSDANPDWMARIAEVRAAADAEKEAEMASNKIPVQPPRVMAEIARRLGKDDIVVSDASFAAGWIAGYIPAKKPGRQFLYARGQGGLGYSVPGAIGAATVLKDGARVVTVAGDGGFSYTVGELATQAQYGQRIVNVVINNGKLGWINFWQKFYFGETISSDLETQATVPNYAGAAKALGLKGIYVDKPDEIGAALDEAFAHDGPSVVEVRIDEMATPIHSFKRRLADGDDKARLRPGKVYKLREWKVSPEL